MNMWNSDNGLLALGASEIAGAAREGAGMKIVILDGYTENPGDLSWNGFEALGEVTVYDRTPFADGSGEIVRRAKGADILIVNKTPLSAETLAKLAPELRYIGVLATGYNVVDTAAAKAQGSARVQYPNLRHCGGGPVCDGVAAGAVPPCGGPQLLGKRGRLEQLSGLLLLEYASHRAGGQDVRRYRLRAHRQGGGETGRGLRHGGACFR